MSKTLDTPTEEGSPSDPRYHTRFGIATASDAALKLLDRSAERLGFLQEVFEIVHNDGHGFTMPGYMTQGLAAILEDIKHDVWTAYGYYYGDDETPGKTSDAPEVRS